MLLINIIGLGIIALIVWWFWLYRPTTKAQGNGTIRVQVEHGTYSPARISLPEGEPAVLKFLRKDASPCAEMVIFPTLDISRELPLNRSTSIEIPALERGQYTFQCQMQMYRGVLNVT